MSKGFIIISLPSGERHGRGKLWQLLLWGDFHPHGGVIRGRCFQEKDAVHASRRGVAKVCESHAPHIDIGLSFFGFLLLFLAIPFTPFIQIARYHVCEGLVLFGTGVYGLFLYLRANFARKRNRKAYKYGSKI
jgi:hypothetical protein